MTMKILSKNIEAELILLKRIHDAPYAYLKDERNFFHILKTQKSFAEFEDKSLCIISCTINTHKHYCDKFHMLGYDHINRLRISAYKKLHSLKNQAKSASQKKDKTTKINNNINHSVTKNNIKLISILLFLKEKLQDYAIQSQNIEIQNDFKIVNKQIEKILGHIHE